MNASNKVARIVGILFIIGTVAGVLSVVFTGSILDDSAYLTKIADKDNQFILGTLFVLIMGLALAPIPLLMYPIFKQYNESLALGYVVFRGALETVCYLTTIIFWLLLLTVSREYTKASAADMASYKTLGTVLLGGGDWITVLTPFIFGFGALIFYYLFYTTQLIPRWLSGWGLGAIVLHIGATLLVLFDVIGLDSATQNLMNLPIFLQEMVLAVWLIVKGFNSSALPARSAR